MVHMIAQMDDTDEMRQAHGLIRAVIAMPFPAEVATVWRERFGVPEPVSGGYGQTECGFVTSREIGVTAPDGSSGRANELFEVAVVDDDDTRLPHSEVGEIVVRPRAADVMFSGYWGRQAETITAFKNLWYHTGDLGRFDGEGWLYFVDRKADYLRRRGENISSFELENAVLQHDEVAEVAALSVPSETSEDDVKLVIVLAEGATLSAEALCRWCIDELPRFAVPRFIDIVPVLPRNAVGRVLKQELRAAHSESPGWDRERVGLAVPH
jgi:crotonobetaine/carnitine-CoA ligase